MSDGLPEIVRDCWERIYAEGIGQLRRMGPHYAAAPEELLRKSFEEILEALAGYWERGDESRAGAWAQWRAHRSADVGFRPSEVLEGLDFLSRLIRPQLEERLGERRALLDALGKLDEGVTLLRGRYLDAHLAMAAETARRLAVSRALVGQMLRDLQAVGGLSEAAMFRAGEELAMRVEAKGLPGFLDAFAAMGLGTLSPAGGDETRRRWMFRGDGLVETKAGSGRPTCHYTRGFLSGAVTRVLGGGRVAGVEVACQSTGDEECRFTVQALGAG